MSNVCIYLPRFETTFSRNFIDDYEKMGVYDIFGPAANLDDIVSGDNAYISKIVQKVKIIVNEEGSEAAVATEVECEDMGCNLFDEPVYKTFNANHTFQCVIRGRKSNMILFSGMFYG